MDQQPSSQGILQSLTYLLQSSGTSPRSQTNSIQLTKYQNEPMYQQRYSALQPSQLSRRKQKIGTNYGGSSQRSPQESQRDNSRKSDSSQFLPSMINGFKRSLAIESHRSNSENPSEFESPLSSTVDEKLLFDLLESFKDIQQQTRLVANTVSSISTDFNNLLHKSQQEKEAFSGLAKSLKATHETMTITNEVVTENLQEVSKTLDEQKNSHHYVKDNVDLLTDHSIKVMNKIDSIEEKIKTLLKKENPSNTNSLTSSTNFITNASPNNNNTLLQELVRFSESIGHQQQNINDLLLGIREYFQQSVGDMHRLKENILILVRDETTDASLELKTTFKKANERTYEQLQILGRDILDFHNSIQDSIASTSRTINQSNRIETPVTRHDHLIPEILDRLMILENESRYRHDKSFTSLVEFIAIQLEQLSKDSRSHLEDVAKTISSTSEQSFSTHQLKSNYSGVNDYENTAGEKKIRQLELQIEQLKAKQQNEITEHEQKVAILESTIQKLESKLRQKCEKESISVDLKYEQLKIKLEETEDKLHEAEVSNRLMKGEVRLLKYLNNDIDRHEETIVNLEANVDQLRSEKDVLNVELGSLNTIYDMRVSELRQLETRVTDFEQRLNQVLLDRSKTILGSATMAIINSSSADQSINNNTFETATDTSETKKLRRHMSLAPIAFDFTDNYTGNKENGGLKKSILDKHLKQRSISLSSEK